MFGDILIVMWKLQQAQLLLLPLINSLEVLQDLEWGASQQGLYNTKSMGENVHWYQALSLRASKD